MLDRRPTFPARFAATSLFALWSLVAGCEQAKDRAKERAKERAVPADRAEIETPTSASNTTGPAESGKPAMTLTAETSNANKEPAHSEEESAAISDAAQKSTAAESAPSPAFNFEPPFPARPNPFAPPDRDSQAASVPSGDDTGGKVVLYGFANVSEPRAVLLIDGEVMTLAAGQTKRGVFVMEIAPPEVTLRRGRYVWKTSLSKAETQKERR